MLANESKIARVKACIRPVHINKTFPYDFRMARVASISNESEKLVKLRVLVDGGEMVVSK